MRETKKRGAIFVAQIATGVQMLLHEFFPQIFVIGDQIERGRQAEVMSVIGQQLHAEAVDGAEESAIEGGVNFRPSHLLQNAMARALLHFIGGAMRERDHDESRQNFFGLWRKRDLHDALGDGVGFAGAGRGDDGKIALDFFGKAAALGMIAR